MKVKIINFYFLISLAFLSGCASFKDSQKKETNFGVIGTELDIDEKIKKGLPLIKGEKGKTLIGPSRRDSGYFSNKKEERKEPVIGVVLGPSLYRSVSYLPIMKKIKKENLKIHFIGGHGLSSLIAAYYAFDKDPSFIEWKLYKLFQKIGHKRPFREKWKQEIRKVLTIDFKERRIEQGKLNLFIPLYNRETKKVSYHTRGKLVPRLMDALDIFGRKKGELSSSIGYEFFNEKLLKRKGIDLLIGLNAIGDSVEMSSGDDYLLGLFSKTAGRVKKDLQALNLYYELKLNHIKLDSVKEVPESLRIGLEDSDIFLDKFNSLLKEWRENSLNK